jgi:NAD(P)-dependent dehydrogenase (short-subunit alcohol dehydrogenase family)
LELWSDDAQQLTIIGVTLGFFERMDSMKTVVITGANRGLGLEHARRYAERGVRVFAAVRSVADADQLREIGTGSSGAVTVVAYDAANPDGHRLLADAVGDTPVDMLLANAGIMGGGAQMLDSIDTAEMLELFRVNSIAPLRLAQVFAGNVAASSRKLIAFQSSQMGSIGDNRSGGYYAYRASKAALNMIAKGVANDLKSRGVVAVTLHPGWVKTRMGGSSAPLTVEQSVAGQQRLFDKLTLADSGRFFNYDGKELPW